MSGPREEPQTVFSSKIAVEFLPEGFVKHTGGVRRTAYDLLGALRSVGVDVDVAQWVDDNPFQFGAPAPSKARRTTLQLEAVARQVSRSSAGRIRHSLYYDPAALVARGPLVATAYDMIHERFGYGSTALRRAKRRVLERADVVVTISAATAADVREYFPTVGNVVPIHLGIAAEFMSPEPDDDLERRSVLFVGYRHHYKNFTLVLDAYRSSAALRSLPLVLVGGPRLTASENADIVAATESPAQQYLGVDDAALRELYDRAVATVIPSRWEGFGLPVLEAMARNCPVACSDTASLAETASGHAELFDPESAEACAAAILAAANLPKTARDAARSHASEFTWQAAARKHVELYARLI